MVTATQAKETKVLAYPVLLQLGGSRDSETTGPWHRCHFSILGRSTKAPKRDKGSGLSSVEETGDGCVLCWGLVWSCYVVKC